MYMRFLEHVLKNEELNFVINLKKKTLSVLTLYEDFQRSEKWIQGSPKR